MAIIFSFKTSQVVYDIMAGGTTEDILKKIFRLFDVNSDGSISKKEMERLVKDMYGLLKREDPNISAADLVAKTAFAEMDKDEDGKVSLEEFLVACKAEEGFSKLLSSAAIEAIFFEEDEEEEFSKKIRPFVF